MKALLIVGAVIIGVVSGLAFGCHLLFDRYSSAPAGTPLPAQFEMQETFLSKVPFVPMTMQIVANGQSFGQVKKSVFTWTPTFTLSDQNGVEQAKARMEAFTLLTKIDVSDAQGTRIGSLHEQFFGSFLPNRTVYSVLDGAGTEVAVSDKIDFFGTDIILKDKATGSPVAVLHRGFWNFLRHTWQVSVLQPNVVDIRVIEMIPAFKTYADHKKSDDDSSKRNK